eukprot:415284_1
MSTALVSFFAFHAIISSATVSISEYYLGAYGQSCPVQPDAICSNTSPTFGIDKAIEQGSGYTQCGLIGDCCGCASISCGNDTTGCNIFFAGDYGAYG